MSSAIRVMACISDLPWWSASPSSNPTLFIGISWFQGRRSQISNPVGLIGWGGAVDGPDDSGAAEDLDPHRQLLPAPDRRGVGLHGVVPVHLPGREALEDLVEGDPALEARLQAPESATQGTRPGRTRVRPERPLCRGWDNVRTTGGSPCALVRRCALKGDGTVADTGTARGCAVHTGERGCAGS